MRIVFLFFAAFFLFTSRTAMAEIEWHIEANKGPDVSSPFLIRGKETQLGPNRSEVTSVPGSYKCFVSEIMDSSVEQQKAAGRGQKVKISEFSAGHQFRFLTCNVNGVEVSVGTMCDATKKEGNSGWPEYTDSSVKIGTKSDGTYSLILSCRSKI